MNSDLPKEQTDNGSASTKEDEIESPSRTPLYEASHAPRYQRQALVKQIQTATKRALICYIAGSNSTLR